MGELEEGALLAMEEEEGRGREIPRLQGNSPCGSSAFGRQLADLQSMPAVLGCTPVSLLCGRGSIGALNLAPQPLGTLAIFSSGEPHGLAWGEEGASLPVLLSSTDDCAS